MPQVALGPEHTVKVLMRKDRISLAGTGQGMPVSERQVLVDLKHKLVRQFRSEVPYLLPGMPIDGPARGANWAPQSRPGWGACRAYRILLERRAGGGRDGDRGGGGGGGRGRGGRGGR
jgi:hypothetical protein